ncbi:putative eukaryotic initiation factor 4f subunit p130 [Diaporthe ampelina]|uniref:Putative eukaryotic initiation factor 4f subunit p130 n=1 Tax=Diaporthe ampelina TaxID=1214573 RepID=A0A0G2I6Z6_9PEZI|nr:putative eukaryotic initiation factor 4f subunit p130 [Diaporthe ampelina]
MDSLARTKPLNVCITRCAELIHDLHDITQFQALQQQVKALLTSLLSMMRVVNPNKLDTSQSDPTNSPGLTLLAAYLHELNKTCVYYGTVAETELELSNEDRGFVLGEISKSFDRLADKLCYLAHRLQALADDEQTDYRTKIQNLCQWAESTFEDWHFFQGEFEAIRVLAAATSAAKKDHSTTRTPTAADDSVDSSSDEIPQKPEHRVASVWDKIGEQLAEEGIQDDAIEKVANDLKACARSLVRGERPRFGPNEPEPAKTIMNSPKKSAIGKTRASNDASDDATTKVIKTSTSGNPANSSAASASTDPTTKESKTTANAKPKPGDAALDDWFNRDFVSSKITVALDRINSKNIDLYLPQLLVVAFRQETEKDSRNFRQALDLIYAIACHDTSRSRLHARLAEKIQAKTPTQIRNIMVNKQGTVGSHERSVTGYLFKKCSVDWDHGKHERNKISVETFALGLSRFIGDLARFGVFNAGHIHSFIRAQWGPQLERNQFMAVCKLLRNTGPMLDSQSDKSDMEDHFKRILSLTNKKKTPEIVKELAQELSSLRSSGWQNKQTKVMDQVEEAIRKKA